MTEYDEIMEKISLSPEARDRIINNIADEMTSSEGYVPFRAKKRISAWKKYITLAACCVLVVTGVMAASRSDLFISLTGEKDMGADTAETAEAQKDSRARKISGSFRAAFRIDPYSCRFSSPASSPKSPLLSLSRRRSFSSTSCSSPERSEKRKSA